MLCGFDPGRLPAWHGEDKERGYLVAVQAADILPEGERVEREQDAQVMVEAARPADGALHVVQDCVRVAGRVRLGAPHVQRHDHCVPVRGAQDVGAQLHVAQAVRLQRGPQLKEAPRAVVHDAGAVYGLAALHHQRAASARLQAELHNEGTGRRWGGGALGMQRVPPPSQPCMFMLVIVMNNYRRLPRFGCAIALVLDIFVKKRKER